MVELAEYRGRLGLGCKTKRMCLFQFLPNYVHVLNSSTYSRLDKHLRDPQGSSRLAQKGKSWFGDHM